MKRLSRALAVFAAFSVMSLLPVVASAHQGDPNYRSVIESVKPSAPAEGLELEIQNFDDHVELVNRTGKQVVVKGYDNEPYFRIGPDGLVEVNLNSPSHYLNEDRYADVELPARADAKAEPDWQEVDQTGRYVWHDHRSHYMGVGTPSQVKDKSKETEVFPYEIPMTVDGTPVVAAGTLTWVGEKSGPPAFIWFVLAGLIVACAIAITVIRRNRGHETSLDGEGSGDQDKEDAEVW
ncbi:MAG: hypothetical protein M3Y23_03000 [Actinomycetota bacterium]|nr:hypothetical protein [Actinomycetota bacterium]